MVTIQKNIDETYQNVGFCSILSKLHKIPKGLGHLGVKGLMRNNFEF